MALLFFKKYAFSAAMQILYYFILIFPRKKDLTGMKSHI